MNIYGLNKTTLLDFPGHVACTIFTGSCNFRCLFCHNSPLVSNPSSLPISDEESVFSFLQSRKNILSGVCITGGEPTLNQDLKDFIIKIKNMGFLVKLDTNGYRPEVLLDLLNSHLLDMVAMDIKSSPKEYPSICGINNLDLSKINSSINILKSNEIPYEFRTTIVKDLFSDEIIIEIGKWLKGQSNYYLQSFVSNNNVMTKGLQEPEIELMNHYRNLLLPYLPNTNLRGV